MLVSMPILPLQALSVNANLDPLEESRHVNNIDKSNDSSDSAPACVATHTRAVGIIYPPFEIRNIVDKTADFVAKNGQDLEKTIIARNEGNSKFSFLRSSDPYHAYYQHRVSENRTLNKDYDQQGVSEPKETSVKCDPAVQFRPVVKVVEPPEAEQYTVRLPEGITGITGEEVDLIKLTAQFVARNGESFLIDVTSRKSNDPQFHFLQPTHSKFKFFTSLVDAYSKVLRPPQGLADKLRNSVVNLTTVLERCRNRLEWEKSEELAKQKAEDKIELERMQMAMIDWLDCVVVETIDFADNEDDGLPLPMTLEEVRMMSNIELDQDIVEPSTEVEMEMDEEEAQLVEEGRAASFEVNNVNTAPEEAPLRIVKNWERPEDRIQAKRDPTKYVVSPITGELITIYEMSEHMRISLIDPKYKEQKDRMFAKIRETTLAADDEISRNIIGLARLRPDIFGTTDEEVSNAVKVEIAKKKDEQPKQVMWDGHAENMSWAASQASFQNTTPHPPKPEFSTIRSLPRPPVVLNMPRPPVVNMIPPVQPSPPIIANWPPPRSLYTPLGGPIHFVPPPPMPQPPPIPEEPEPKRLRLDDSILIPEDQFLAKFEGLARVTISVSLIEGNLKGQKLEITVQSLSETVGSLKDKIAGEIQLPANKQKLSGKAGFLKDNLSLAYYNVAPGDSLSLSLKERGGRKR